MTPVMAKSEAAALVDAARTRQGLSWREIADKLDAPLVRTVARRSDPDGDRVVVTFNGKFLDYRW